jgi:hypothetical protein
VVEILHDDTKALILLPHHPHRDSTWFYDTAGLTRSYSILRYQLVSWLVTERIEGIECLQHANDRYDEIQGRHPRWSNSETQRHLLWNGNMMKYVVSRCGIFRIDRITQLNHRLSFVSLSWNILEHCQTLICSNCSLPMRFFAGTLTSVRQL